MCDRRLPRAQDVRPPRRPAARASGSTTSTSSHDNQVARLRDARDREDGAAAGHHHPPPDHLRPPHRHRRRPAPWRKKLTPPPLVRLPADAGPRSPGRPRTILTAVRDAPRATSPATSASTPSGSQVILLGRRRRLRAADRAAGARPDPGDGQRRRPDEGHRHAARGVRQAAHRARRRARARHPPQAGRPHRAARSTGSAIADAVTLRPRHQRRRAGRADGLGRGGLRAVALRGLLAADRRADGLRDPAGGVSRAGAIPEVVGPDGDCADLVDAR